ncbi:bifunctional folylpolyglutamate synthase/dihydrofolate synthase [Algoriphagus namhaensis]
MTYQEALDFMYSALPMFHRVGAAAFKKDLSNTQKLCAHLGNPETQFKSVHVAGTNGKGSTSHSLASIFQAAGYKTGLYTSPHLKSFTERIRIDGLPIPESDVVDFVETNYTFLDELRPSFFEMTVAMSFWYFAKQNVDMAIIEVGMGGRLDSTNVILPELSVITSIGYDHMQFLGNTLAEIAGEKAGIIKSNTPVVISLTQEETKPVFIQKALEEKSEVTFADQFWQVERQADRGELATYAVSHGQKQFLIELDLLGDYQKHNLPGILEAIEQLKRAGYKLSDEAVQTGLKSVVSSTGLKGRWQRLGENPAIICDTGHNEAGFRFILNQLKSYSFHQLWMVIGFVQDKDLTTLLEMLPREAKYIFCQADLPRAMPAEELKVLAEAKGLRGEAIPNVNEALATAQRKAAEDDLIFVGGSTFVVAEIENL